jgi:hypothetical protein
MRMCVFCLLPYKVFRLRRAKLQDVITGVTLSTNATSVYAQLSSVTSLRAIQCVKRLLGTV